MMSILPRASISGVMSPCVPSKPTSFASAWSAVGRAGRRAQVFSKNPRRARPLSAAAAGIAPSPSSRTQAGIRKAVADDTIGHPRAGHGRTNLHRLLRHVYLIGRLVGCALEMTSASLGRRPKPRRGRRFPSGTRGRSHLEELRFEFRPNLVGVIVVARPVSVLAHAVAPLRI